MAFHAIAPQSGASTSSSYKKPCYDVFINYRGKDVKHKLASTIYNMFDLMDVKVFRDEEELELGDSFPHVIEEAIRSASVHIAIFSPSYAESPWCLEELSLMLQINATIIPVFYGVQPSDVRYVTRGIYAQAFGQHEGKRRYNPQKIKEWKDSLSRVSYLSGCIVDGDKCDEGKLSRGIVETALRKMKMKTVQDFQWLKIWLRMLEVAQQYAGKHVNDTVWDAEDILDEYSLQENGTHDMLLQQWIEEFNGTVWNAVDILDEYSLHKDITDVGGQKMKEIKEPMNSIMETADKLKLIREVTSSETVACTVQPGGKWKKSSIMEYGSLPVAVDIKAQNIIERLDDPAVQVLAVVGMGGIGKTFLIQHVYNKVEPMFQNSIWLSISQTYSLEQLQRDLAFKLNLNDLANSKVSCTMGAEIIHHRLKETKCLIVLDDVWRATEEDDLLRSLGIPIGVNNRCKVIVTSRNKVVFSHLRPFIYEMALLSAEDSWKLFCAHAFSYSH